MIQREVPSEVFANCRALDAKSTSQTCDVGALLADAQKRGRVLRRDSFSGSARSLGVFGGFMFKNMSILYEITRQAVFMQPAQLLIVKSSKLCMMCII